MKRMLLAIGLTMLAGVAATSSAQVGYSLKLEGHEIKIIAQDKTVFRVDGKDQPLNEHLKIGAIEVTGKFAGKVLLVHWNKSKADLTVSLLKKKPAVKRGEKAKSSPFEQIRTRKIAGKKITVIRTKMENVVTYIFVYELTASKTSKITCQVVQHEAKSKTPKEFEQAVRTLKVWEVK